MPLPGVEVDEKRIVTSTGALELDAVPDHLVVIGGGYIGLELGSVWRRLGAEVTVVEFLDRIVPGMDGEVAHSLRSASWQSRASTFRLGTKVTGAQAGNDGVTLTLEPAKGGAAEEIEGRHRAGGDRPPAVSPTGSGWTRPAWRSTSAAGSRPTRISPPTCPASTPSAT